MRLARSLGLTLLLSLLSLTGLTAHAATLTIDHDLPPAAAVVGTSFAADAANDRAWVVVYFVESTAEGDLVHAERVAVPGLSYDPATRTIRLQDGDRQLTCAVGRKVLWATSFRATSDCPIGVRKTRTTEARDLAPADKTRIVIEVGAAP